MRLILIGFVFMTGAALAQTAAPPTEKVTDTGTR